MITVATSTIRAELPSQCVVASIRAHVLARAAARGMRVGLLAEAATGQIVATSGEARVDDEWFVGSRVYHTVTAVGASDSELTCAYDGRSGELRALAIGTDLGEMRNGALGALFAGATLGRQAGLTLAVLGAGRQALAQCEYLLALPGVFAEARVSCPSTASFHRLTGRLEHRLADGCRFVASPEEAVRGADVVVTATSSARPVLDVGWLRPGVSVIHVGEKKRGRCEVPHDLYEISDPIVTDCPVQFERDLGSFTYPFERAPRGLADVMEGDVLPEGTTGSRPRLFVSNCLPGGEIAILARWLRASRAPARTPQKNQ